MMAVKCPMSLMTRHPNVVNIHVPCMNGIATLLGQDKTSLLPPPNPMVVKVVVGYQIGRNNRC